MDRVEGPWAYNTSHVNTVSYFSGNVVEFVRFGMHSQVVARSYAQRRPCMGSVLYKHGQHQ